jgi:hypothetical protein
MELLFVPIPSGRLSLPWFTRQAVTYFRFEFLESALGQNRVSVFTSTSRPNGRRAAASWKDQLRHSREWLTRLADAKE